MRARTLLLLVLACLWPVASSALTITVGSVGDEMTVMPAALGCGDPDEEDGSFTCSGMNLMSMGGTWTLSSWELSLDPDPLVFANTVLKNTSASTQTFFLKVVLPISPSLGPPVRIDGSIQGGVTDTNGNGSALLSSVSPTAIYRAAIDGTVVRTLLNHPSSVSVSGAFQSASFIPSPGFSNEIVGTSATTNIAIFLNFSLSPGDSASFTSVFNVIPEPSTALLAGFGLLGLLAAGRRRKAHR